MERGDGVTHTEFARKLKLLNPALMYKPGAQYMSGLYIHEPGFEFSDEKTGLRHLCGVPSPSHFFGITDTDFLDEKGHFIRGLKSILWLLVENGYADWEKAGRIFGKRYFEGEVNPLNGRRVLGEKPAPYVAPWKARKAAIEKEWASYRPIYASAVAP